MPPNSRPPYLLSTGHLCMARRLGAFTESAIGDARVLAAGPRKDEIRDRPGQSLSEQYMPAISRPRSATSWWKIGSLHMRGGAQER